MGKSAMLKKIKRAALNYQQYLAGKKWMLESLQLERIIGLNQSPAKPAVMVYQYTDESS